MTESEILKAFIQSTLGTPYIWGGNNPVEGYDCSGLIQDALASIGLDPRGDQNSQSLHDYFINKELSVSTPSFGDLLFFGKNARHITHVAMAVNESFMFEAGGGGSSTNTREDAAKQNACVRIREIRRRNDLVVIITTGINK